MPRGKKKNSETADDDGLALAATTSTSVGRLTNPNKLWSS